MLLLADTPGHDLNEDCTFIGVCALFSDMLSSLDVKQSSHKKGSEDLFGECFSLMPANSISSLSEFFCYLFFELFPNANH